MVYRVAPTIKYLLLMQCVAAGIVFAGGWLFWGLVVAYSGLIGAVSSVLPNMYFALRVSDMSKGRGALPTLRAFYAGAAGKFVMTMALFWTAFFLVSPLNVFALFGGFALVHAVHWPALLMKEPAAS